MKLNQKTIFAIAKKEFMSFFNSTTAYILIIPFLLITTILYLRTSFLFGQASLRPYFEVLPYFLILIAPAIAMRTFSQQQKNKTLEVFFAHPISEVEIVVSKFIGALGFYVVMLATTFLLPLTSLIFSKPDIMIIISQYFGALWVGAAFIAVSIACASLTDSQVGSFLLSAAISFALVIIGFDFILMSLSPALSSVISQIAIMSHASNISRGYIDLRDLLYFITVIAAFLTIATIKLSSRKTIENPTEKRKLNIALGLILAIGFVANLLMYSFPIRLDVTRNHLFSLSRGTKQTLEQLPDIVTINLYTTRTIPGNLESDVQKVKDTIRDYQSASKGKVKLIQRYPDTEEEDLKLAEEDGILQVQFNQYGVNSTSVSAGFFGASIYFANQKEVIPFFNSTDDIEYQLTSLIRQMTVDEKPILSVYTPSQSMYDQTKAITTLTEVLSNQYEIQNVSLDDEDSQIDGQNLLVHGLVGPLGATASAKIEAYLSQGGNATLLLDQSKTDSQTGGTTPFPTGLEDILETYGVTLNQDMVYDLAQNEIIQLSTEGRPYLLPYPYWNQALIEAGEIAPLSGIQYATLGWSSSMSLSPMDGVAIQTILKSSSKTGSQTNVFYTDPASLVEGKGIDEEDLSEKTLAVAITKNNQKISVVGDSDFITEQFLTNNPNNLNFALGLIEWGGGDEVLSSIVRKTGDNPVYLFRSSRQAITVQWINIILPSALVAGFGFWYLLRRKKLSRRVYK